MNAGATRVAALRRALLLIVGTFGWGVFAASVLGHIATGMTAADPPIYWLYDWHVHYTGAIDLIDRDLYRQPLSLPGWPLPTPVFNLPPASALIAVPFLPLGREIGGLVWLVIGVVALVLSTLMATRIARIDHGWAWVGMAFLGYTGVYFFVGHVTLGNVNHIMLALLVAFTWAHLEGRQRLAGILLGAAIAIKIWPVTLVVLLVRGRRWSELRWTAGVVVVQGLAVLAWLGPDVLAHLIESIRTDLPLGPDAVFMWTTWLREIVGFPPWFAPILAFLLLLIPARRHLGLGLGMLAGLSLINNIWNHYLPTFAVAALFIGVGIRDAIQERRGHHEPEVTDLPAPPRASTLPSVSRAQRALILAAPGLAAASYILDLFAQSPSHWSEVVRPVLVVAAASSVATLAIAAITRRPTVGAILVLAALLVVATGTWWFLTLGIVVAVLGTVALAPPIRDRWMATAPSILAVMPPLILVVGLARLVVVGGVTIEDFAVKSPVVPDPDYTRRNMYVALLDGYPRADSLREFGWDNGPFLGDLTDLGFDVYDDAESDYPRTEVALAAMLWPTPPEALSRFVDPPDLLAARREVRRDQLAEAPGVDELAAAGYRTVYVPSPISHTALVGWLDVHEGGQVNAFEVSLIQRSAFAPLLAGWVMDQQRQRVDYALAVWAQPWDGEPPGQPRAVFAHIMAPHVPFLYEADGSPSPVPDCWLSGICSLFDVGEMPLTPTEHAEALAAQVDALNVRLLSVVTELVEADPDALIVLLSDHGARYEPGVTPEWHASFMAARTPGAPRLFEADPGPNGLFFDLLEAAARP